MTIADKPLMPAETHIGTVERKAIAAYRELFPNGPLWQELAASTRSMWVEHAEGKTP